MKRISRMLILIGIMVLMITVITGTKTRSPLMVIDREAPQGFIFESNQDVYLNVTLDHSVGTFDMYLLHWEDANDTMVQNQSSNPISPISSYENITSFLDVLQIPFSGTFALLFTTNSTDLVILSIEISTQGINPKGFIGGLVLVASGLVIFTYQGLHKYTARARSHENNV